MRNAILAAFAAGFAVLYKMGDIATLAILAGRDLPEKALLLSNWSPIFLGVAVLAAITALMSDKD